MQRDEIIVEVWRNREAYSRAHHNNLNDMVADLRRRERAHPERVVDLRKCRSVGAARQRTG